MADSFLNPQDQAQLEQLRARLAQLDAEIRGVTEQVAAQNAAVRESQSRAQYATRAEGAAGARSTETALPSLREEVAAIDAQVVSYERLNQLITERIALEARAATAARETAGAAGVAPAGRAGGTVVGRQRILDIAEQDRQHVFGTAGAGAAAAGAATGGAGAATRLAAGQAEAATTARTMLASEEELRLGIQQAAAQMVQFDDSLMRSGGSSAAAIKALANGTLTVRELGAQVGTTVAKFAGWTAAATAVFGVVGALNEVRHGAIDTSSAIQGLTRFLPDLNKGQAQQSIIGEARSHALPVNEVGDTAQQFAKVFKNQDDVFTATHVSLSAAKLDTIALADSYKYFTAIVQETGIHVSALPGIFDQLTAAQDRLGARMSQLLPAFAGSLGAVKTSGGDPSQLLGLEALTLVRTGRSGSVVATGYARGSTNFFPTAASRGVMERFGINPDQGFTQALIEAITKSSQENLPEAARRGLSTAFFGPLRGSLFTNLFNTKPEQLQHFLQQTSPGAAKGLADQQLGKTMAQANNQLALLKTNLQAIGSELTGSSIDTPFALLLEIINKTLEATGDLLHAFDQLPAPLKEAASWAAVIGGGVALARRFNVGAGLAERDSSIAQFVAPALARNPEKLLKAQANEYMGGLTGVISGQLQSASVRQAKATLEVAQANEKLAAVTSSEAASSEEVAAANDRLALAKTNLATANEDVGFYSGMGSEASLARFRGDFIAGGGFAGTAAGSRAAGGADAGVGEGAVIGGAAAGGAVAMTERFGVAEADAMEAVFGTTLALEGFSGVLAFAASNAIPGFIAALIAFDLASQSIKDTNKSYTQGLSRIQGSTTADQARRGYNEVVGGGTFRVPFVGVKVPNAFGAIANLLGGRDTAAGSALQAQLNYLSAQNRAFNDTSPLMNRVAQDERQHKYGAAFQAFRNDKVLKLENPGEYNKVFNDLYIKSTGEQLGGKAGSNPFAEWMQASQDLKNKLQPMLQSYGNSLKVFGTNQGDVSELVHGYIYAVMQFGNNPKDQQAMAALAQASQELKSSLDQQVQDLVSLAQSSSSGAGMVSDYKQALGAVSTYQKNLREASAQAEKLRPQDKPQIERAEKKAIAQSTIDRQSAIQGLLGYEQSRTQLQTAEVPGIGPAADLQRAQVQLQGLKSQLAAAHKYGADATTLNQLQAQVDSQAVTVLQDHVAYLQQLTQAETQYQQGGTADPVQQAQIAINQLDQLYTKLKSAGADPITLLNVLGQKRADILQQVASQISLEGAQQQANLAQMNIGQPQQVQLQNALTVAQRTLAYLQSLPANKVNPITLVQAQANVYQAQGAIAQFVIQQGEQLIQAEAQLAQASTFDPVAIANDALAGAKRLLAYDKAHNMPAAQITQDEAQVAADFKASQESQWQKKEATIQFLASTYQITGAQEINRLKSLMATMKKAHASYQSIQQVAQELWNLEYGNTGNLNLNTGAIHLPSTYEVKSAILGGRERTRRKTSAGLLAEVKNEVQLTVIVNKGGDARKVYDEIQRALGTSINGLAQAAGMV